MQTNVYIKLLIAFSVLFVSNIANGQIIAEELFNEPTGSTSGTMSDGSVWAAGIPGQCDANPGIWSVQPTGFVIQDVEGFNCCNCGSGGSNPPLNCGNNQSFINFTDIDISGACSGVDITIIWSGSAGMECDFPGSPEFTCTGGHDQLVAEYSIDNGPFIQFGYLCGNMPLQIPSTGFVISGNSLDIRISGGNQAASETYTVTSVTVSATSSPITATLSGGGDLCGTNCTTVDWEITGGTPNYTLMINFTLGAINLNFNIPAASSMGSLNVCLDPNIPLPFYQVATNTLFLNQLFGSLATIELTGVTDNANCVVNLIGQIVDINLLPPPTITDIPDISICTDQNNMATIDLTTLESGIGGTNTVLWYSNPGLTNMIGPNFTTSTNTTIYAVVESGGCLSPSISIAIFLTLTPLLNPMQDVEACDEYLLPSISGSNLTANAGYFSMPQGMGIKYIPGQIINFSTILYIYDFSGNCNDQEFFEITIFPSPTIDQPFSTQACGYYILPPITGNNVSPFAVYYELPGGSGNSFAPGDTIFSSIALYAYDILGFCPDEKFFTILISQAPEINMPLSLSACGSLVLPVITGNNITGSAAYYTGMNGMGANYMPGDIILSTTILFIYDAIGNCSSQQEININISDGPILIDIPDTTVCDFFILPDIMYSNTSQAVNTYFSGPFGNLKAGDTLFGPTPITYDFGVELVSNPDCDDEDNFSVTFIAQPNAGSNDTIALCVGSIIDLRDLIPTNVDNTGIFSDPLGTGALTNDSLNSNNIGGLNQLTVNYIISNICGEDTSKYVFNFANQVNAGTDVINQVCNGTIINPDDYILGDIGGDFYDLNTGLLVTGNIFTNGQLGNIFELYYIIGDGANCPLDSAIYSFEVIQSPEFTAQPIIQTCGFYSLPVITGTGLDGSEYYSSEIGGNGIKYEPGDSILFDQVVYLFYDNQVCSAQDSLILYIGQNSVETINQTLCPDGFIIVNNTTYDVSLPIGTEKMTNAIGCDSTININLSFEQIDTTYLSDNLCFGQFLEINSTTYDENNASGVEVFENMASTGCDSIVKVNLVFTSSTTNLINEIICSSDSILINGKYYSINNPSGLDTIKMTGQCDSILSIQLNFLNPSTGNYTTTICSTETININGTIYDIVNPNGQETIVGGNMFGCDSIVNISLSFFNITSGVFEDTYCSGEVIEIFGETFSESNPTQVITLQGASSQGCDSVILVNLNFIDVEEGLITESICSGSTILINGTTYNELNPVGQFTTQTNDGCDSIVNVMVSFTDVNSDLEIINPSCDNTNLGYIIFNGLSEVSVAYSYRLDNSSFETISIGDTIINISAGNHVLELQTQEGCVSINEFEIKEVSTFELSIPQEITLIEGNIFSYNLVAPANSNILWSPNIDISCTDCDNPIFSPKVETEYVLQLTTSDGCMFSDTILIRVEQVNNIYIPNIFSPNSDGVNERFFLMGEMEGVYNMFIYDRWGNKMFEGIGLEINNSTEGWDGKFNGSLLDPGVFVFYAEYFDLTDPEKPKSKIINGDITIIN